MNNNRVIEIERGFFVDEMETEKFMLEKEVEYLLSDKAIDENVRANEYEFTEEGKRV